MRCVVRQPPKTYTQVLREHGYYVNWENKTDFNFHPPDAFADECTDWLARLEQGQTPPGPFLLYHNFTGTHEGGMWPPGTDAGYDPHTPGYSGPQPEPGVAGIDESMLEGIPVPEYLPDTRTTRWSLWRYYRQLAHQDALFGRYLRAIDHAGLRDNTVVIYLSDHGRGLVREKRWMIDAGFHLPLIVRGPGIEAGVVREDLVSWVDLAPTLMSLSGMDAQAIQALGYDGRIMLGDATEPEPECIFAGRDRMDECTDRVRAARDRRYLYLRNDLPDRPYAQRLQFMELSPVTREVRELHRKGQLTPAQQLWMSPTKPPEELYDVLADPDCVHNLAGAPEQAATLDRLRQATRSWTQGLELESKSESELVEAGIIEDERPRYGPRTEPLPDELDPEGVYRTQFDPAWQP